MSLASRNVFAARKYMLHEGNEYAPGEVMPGAASFPNLKELIDWRYIGYATEKEIAAYEAELAAEKAEQEKQNEQTVEQLAEKVQEAEETVEKVKETEEVEKAAEKVKRAKPSN
jgi:hypothetical protein